MNIVNHAHALEITCTSYQLPSSFTYPLRSDELRTNTEEYPKENEILCHDQTVVGWKTLSDILIFEQ